MVFKIFFLLLLFYAHENPSYNFASSEGVDILTKSTEVKCTCIFVGFIALIAVFFTLITQQATASSHEPAVRD